MSKRAKLVVGLVILAVGLVMALAALWWWALRGMSAAVGSAWSITATVFVMAGVIVCMAAEEEV